MLSEIGERLYEDLERIPQEDGALEALVDAFSAPFEKGAWVRGLDTDAIPYRQAMSVATAPAWLLPWLGQFVGVTVPKGMTEIDARALIMARAHQLRGLPQTIIDTTKAFLSGDKFVYLQEHADDDPFVFRLYLRTSEAPADLTALKQAISAIKPAAFTFEIVTASTLTWNAALDDWDSAQDMWDQPGSPPNP